MHLSEQPKSDPIYTIEEIRKHNSKQTRIWVTYKEGVYDITDFVDNHPGGEIIMMAAGNAVDPFWNMYGVHKQPQILGVLESFRIGKTFVLRHARSLSRNSSRGDRKTLKWNVYR